MDTRNHRNGSTAPTDPDTLHLEVSGMTCSACAVRIEKKISKLPGVTAEVNFATERAIIRGLPPKRISEALKAITDAGYTARSLPRRSSPRPLVTDQNPPSMLLRRLIVAALLSFPLGNLAITLALVPGLRFPLWDWLCVALATPVVFWSAWPFHRTAFKNLRHGGFSMDTLVSIGTLSAYFWSVASILWGDKTAPGYWVGFGPTPPGADSIYLEVAAGVSTFLLAGRYFEAKSRRSAADVLGALSRLAVRSVRVATQTADGRWEETVAPVEELKVGDLFIARPGDTIASDGTIIDGISSVDTSAMTGEPQPRTKKAGETVAAGTISLDGRLVIRATGVGENTQLARLAQLAEDAQTNKAKVQALVDKVVAIFVPVILIAAPIVFFAWLAAGSTLSAAFGASIAVLIIACPCAMGLATPMALMVGVGRGSQLGILIKGQQALESSGYIDTVVLDKTGTLTTGEMTAAAPILHADIRANDAIRLAASVEAASEHPAAKALVRYALAAGVETAPVHGFRAFPGLGVSGSIDGHQVVVGNAQMLEKSGITVPLADHHPWTTVYMARGLTLVAEFPLQDTVRTSAASAVEHIKTLGLRTILLSGDAPAPSESLAAELGIDEVVSEVQPTEKAEVVAKLQSSGRKVAMVGDGVNDAGALATANLGLALVSGTDVAMKSADIILIREDLNVIPDAIRLSRQTLHTVRGNLLWAFAYNIAAIPLAAFGLLNPLIAGAAMSLSSLFVVTNSLRLRNFEPTPAITYSTEPRGWSI